MNFAIILLWVLFLGLFAYTASRGQQTLRAGIRRWVEQFFVLVPRMIVALIAAGFIAKLIPATFIAEYLGEGSGIKAILIATGAGLLVPAGPSVAFSIAAVFARADASVPALIAFITSWSVFAAHRMFIYEIPLLGWRFLRMRVLSSMLTPIIAGLIGIAVSTVVALPSYGAVLGSL